MATRIQWTNETWNPIVGCSKVSEGCKNCYAERMAKRLKAMSQPQYQDVVDENGWTGEAEMVSIEMLEKPFTWKKPRMVFVCSMSDLFHESVYFGDLHWIMGAIEENPQHTFQILTKRAERMAEYFSTHPVPDNVWLGVTTENQARADERIPHLLRINAKVRFVSVEPILGPVDLQPFLQYPPLHDNYKMSFDWQEWRGLDWVICGGESGPGARPMHPDWARSLRDQCQAANVPFFFKQWGEWTPMKIGVASSLYPYEKRQNWSLMDDICSVRCGKKAAGHLLDGQEWHQMPATDQE